MAQLLRGCWTSARSWRGSRRPPIGDFAPANRRFRDRFVDAYRHAAEVELDEAAVEEGIRRRIDALARWLDEP